VEEVHELSERGKKILTTKGDETRTLATTAWASGKSGWFAAHEHASIEALEAAQVYCESRAMLALVQFRAKEHMRGSVNVRTAATSYFQLGDALHRHPKAGPVIERVEAGDLAALKLESADEEQRRLFELVVAVVLGVNIFKYFTSLIPPSFQWIAKALGFQIDRTTGLANIRAVARTVLSLSEPRTDEAIKAASAGATGDAAAPAATDAAAADDSAPATASASASSAAASASASSTAASRGRPPRSADDITPFAKSSLIPPRAPMGALLAAWVECFQTEQFDQCDEILAACLRIWPRGGMFSYLGGYLARRAGDMSLAIRLFDHALGALTGHFEHATQGCLYEKAQCMMLTGSWEDAATMFGVFLDGYSGKNYVACAWQELGYCLHALGKPVEAAAAMAKAPPRVRDHYTFDRFNGRKGTEYVDRGGISRASWLAMGAWYLFRGGRPGDAMAFCVRCSEILDELCGKASGAAGASWVDAVASEGDGVDRSIVPKLPPRTDDDIVECDGAASFVEGCTIMPEFAKRDADTALSHGKGMLVPGSTAYSDQEALDKAFVRDAAAVMLVSRGRALVSLAQADMGQPARNAKSARSTVTRQMAYELGHGAAKRFAAPGSGGDDASETDIILVKSKVSPAEIIERARECFSLAAELAITTPEVWVAPQAHFFYATTYLPAPGASPSAADSAAAKAHIEKALSFSKYDFDKPLFRSLSALKERF
jgi:TolA-binding protein